MKLNQFEMANYAWHLVIGCFITFFQPSTRLLTFNRMKEILNFFNAMLVCKEIYKAIDDESAHISRLINEQC